MSIWDKDGQLHIKVAPSDDSKPFRVFKLEMFSQIDFEYPEIGVIKETTEVLLYNLATNTMVYRRLNFPLFRLTSSKQSILKMAGNKTTLEGFFDLGPYLTSGHLSLYENRIGVTLNTRFILKADLPKEPIIDLYDQVSMTLIKKEATFNILRFKKFLYIQPIDFTKYKDLVEVSH